jgi:hypothetical protein
MCASSNITPERDRTRASSAIATALVAVLLGLCGCAGGRRVETAHRVSTAARQPAIVLASPAVSGEAPIPARYTCSGSVWLPLHWGRVPAGTAELILYTGVYGPKKALSANRTLSFTVAESLLVGLRPTLHELPAGRVPNGARVLSRAGVPVCPGGAAKGEIVFLLYALPYGKRMGRELVSSPMPPRILGAISGAALAEGRLGADYGAT